MVYVDTRPRGLENKTGLPNSALKNQRNDTKEKNSLSNKCIYFSGLPSENEKNIPETDIGSRLSAKKKHE